MVADRVVLHDAQGRVLWGEEPNVNDYLPQPINQDEPFLLEMSFLDGGSAESNMLRPRISIHNQDTRDIVEGFTVGFFIKNQGLELPLLEHWWDPSFQGSLEHVGDYILIKFKGNHRLNAGQRITLGEWGLHMQDYRNLDKSGLGASSLFLQDAQGNLLFGQLPVPGNEGPSSEQSDSTWVRVEFSDGGPWEQNHLRPRVELQHISGAALEAGYRIVLQIPGQFGPFLPNLTAWYAPDWTGTINADIESPGLVLEWTTRHRLTENQTVNIQDWGLHYSNWSTLDKSGVGHATLKVFTSDGKQVQQ
jgi:hypothetical protein